MTADTLLCDEPEPHIRVLTINRPAVLNATDSTLAQLLDSELSRAERDDVRCLVLTGSGTRAFSAGNDIDELQRLTTDELCALNANRERWTWHWATSPIPTIAALNGLAYGNGAILALASDLRVGGGACSMRVTATGFGSANDTWILPQLVGWSYAKDMLLTGRAVPAEELDRMGLLNRFVEDADVLAEALGVAAMIAAHPPSGPQDAKRLIHEAAGLPLHERFSAESALQAERLRTTAIPEAFGRRSPDTAGDSSSPQR